MNSHNVSLVRILVACSALALFGVACGDDEGDTTDTGGSAGQDATTPRDAQSDAAKDAKVDGTAGSAGNRDSAADVTVDAATTIDAGSEATAPKVDASAPEVGTTVDATTAPDVSTVDARVDAPTITPEAGPSEAGVNEAATTEAAAPEAAAPEAATPEAGPREAGLDASVDSSSPSDAGADVQVVDARVEAGSDATGADACNPYAACLACETEQCPDLIDPCNAFTGVQKTNCLAVLKCVRDTSCHTNTALDCYCGTADTAQCVATSGAIIANGACKAQIETAAGTTDPNAIQTAFTDVTFPQGAALFLAVCDTAACKDSCVPYGATCN